MTRYFIGDRETGLLAFTVAALLGLAGGCGFFILIGFVIMPWLFG